MAASTESLQALAFLYLTFSHATDGSLTGEEMRAVAKKLQAWSPDATLEQLGAVLESTVAEYKTKPSRQEKYAHAEALVTALAQHVGPTQRQTIVDDLASLAEVDGVVSDAESAFIRQIAQTLGVNPPA